MICHLLGLIFEGLVPLALVASGCTVSLLEPLLAAFEAEKPGSVNKIWPLHIHKLGLSPLRLLHIPNCSLHLAFAELEAPAFNKQCI